MSNTNRPYVAPYISSFLMGLAMSIWMTYIPLYAYNLGASEVEVGLIAGSQSILYIIMLVLFNSVLDKIGPKRAVLFGSTILVSINILYFIISQPIWFIPLKVIEGLGAAFIWPSFQSLFSESGNRLRMYNIMWSSSVVLAPYIGGVIAQTSELRNIFYISGLLIVCVIALTFLFPKMSKRQIDKNTIPGSVSKIGKKEFSYLLFSIMFSFPLIIVTTFFPIFATSNGISVIETGYILAVSSLGRILSFFFPFSLLKTFRKDKVLQLTILAAALVPITIVYSYDQIAFLYLGLFAFGLFTGLLYSPVQYRVLNIDANRKGYYAGILEASIWVGYLIGPILGGFVASITLNGVFFLPLIICIPILLFALIVRGH
jgi:MFS family permease